MPTPSQAKPKSTPKPGTDSSQGLPHHRSEAIASLTTKARALSAEGAENAYKIDILQTRQAAIRNELTDLHKQVLEHAWDGNPP